MDSKGYPFESIYLARFWGHLGREHFRQALLQAGLPD